MATPEGNFKKNFINKLEKEFPDAIITKLEADLKNGIPDILILHKDRWATLEAKASEAKVHEKRRNKLSQDYYVSRMNRMSYSSYVYPENERKVLDELKDHFQRP